ncbi:MAG: 3'-5' exonuclease [Nanoarchaeota archaeon]|nr:3'-5' exonuclease [Nanoarchaeota archaeon]
MKTLVIDTETTGLSPKYNKTLTVGMLLIDVEKDFLEIMDSNHIFIKHENYSIDPMALKINKISIGEHHKIALAPSVACKKINQFVEKNNLKETPLLGHNLNFDKGFLDALFRQGNSSPKFFREYIDTMHIWKHLKRKNIVSWELRSNLQTLAEFFSIDYSNSHDALQDCHITAKVYNKMLGII